MSRISLIRWNEAEAAERAERLRGAGHEVEIPRLGGGTSFRTLFQKPPELFVIDLSRLPAQGRDLAILLRQRKPTRGVPIVFVGGAKDKVDRVRRVLPDAVYTEWRRIRASVRSAMANPPGAPVVPGTMDGYSGTPLPKKLGIKPGSIVALLGAPARFEGTLGELPEGVVLREQARGPAGVIVLFARSRAELKRRLPGATRALDDGGRLWIAWLKKASGIPTDLDERTVRGFGLGSGLVDYKICAIDRQWSGLCFARRRRRAGEG